MRSRIEGLTPFGGIFSIMEQFDSKLSSVIDSTLGMRYRLYGYHATTLMPMCSRMTLDDTDNLWS